MTEAVAQRCSVKSVLKNFAKFTENNQKTFGLGYKVEKAYNFIKKETLAQVFCCEFCEIFKNTFSYRTPLVADSEMRQKAQAPEVLLNIISNIRSKFHANTPFPGNIQILSNFEHLFLYIFNYCLIFDYET